MSYDSAGNVVQEEGRGKAEPSGSEVSLSKQDRFFDNRNRLFKTETHVFHYAGRGDGGAIPIDGGTLDPGSPKGNPNPTSAEEFGRFIFTDAEAERELEACKGSKR